MPNYPLTASRTSVTVGLPARVVPVALLGGDRPAWALDDGDLAALLIGLAAGWIAVRVGPDVPRGRARRLRLLGGGVLGGLWFVSPGAFVALLVALVAAALVWLLARFVRGARLAFVTLALLGVAGFFGLVSLVFVSGRSAQSVRTVGYSDVAPASAPAPARDADHKVTGNWLAQNAAGGVLEGVTPVALTLPSYTHSLDASRELVTRERPFHPTLYYVTSAALWPLALLWLVAAALLLLAHRGPIAETSRWIRARLRAPAAAPVTPPPPAAREEP
jgi:hypothetical protein